MSTTETVTRTARCPEWCAGHDGQSSTAGADGWIAPLVKGDLPYRWHERAIGSVRLSMIETEEPEAGAMSASIDIIETEFEDVDAVERLIVDLQHAATIMRGAVPLLDPDDVEAALVANINAAQVASGLTESELAHKAAIPRVSLVRKLAGRGGLSVRETAALARALDTTLSRLLTAPTKHVPRFTAATADR